MPESLRPVIRSSSVRWPRSRARPPTLRPRTGSKPACTTSTKCSVVSTDVPSNSMCVVATAARRPRSAAPTVSCRRTCRSSSTRSTRAWVPRCRSCVGGYSYRRYPRGLVRRRFRRIRAGVLLHRPGLVRRTLEHVGPRHHGEVEGLARRQRVAHLPRVRRRSDHADRRPDGDRRQRSVSPRIGCQFECGGSDTTFRRPGYGRGDRPPRGRLHRSLPGLAPAGLRRHDSGRIVLAVH